MRGRGARLAFPVPTYGRNWAYDQEVDEYTGSVTNARDGRRRNALGIDSDRSPEERERYADHPAADHHHCHRGCDNGHDLGPTVHCPPPALSTARFALKEGSGHW